MSKKVGGAGDMPVARVEPKQNESVEEPNKAEESNKPERSEQSSGAEQRKPEGAENDNPDVQATTEGRSDFSYKAANDNALNLTGTGRADPARSRQDAQKDYSNFLEMARINAEQARGNPSAGTWMDRSELNNKVFAGYAAARADDPAYMAELVKQVTTRPPPDNTVSLATLSRLEGPQRQAVVNALRSGYEQGAITDKDIYGPGGKPFSATDPVHVMWNEARKGAAPPESPMSKAALDAMSQFKDLATVGNGFAEALGAALKMDSELFTSAGSGIANLGNGAVNVADALMRLPGASEEQRPALLAQLGKGVADFAVGLKTFQELMKANPSAEKMMRASGLGNLIDGALTFFTPGHSTAEGLEAAAKIGLAVMQMAPVPPLNTAGKFVDVGLAGMKLIGGFQWAGGVIDRDLPELGELLRKSFI